MPTPTSLSQSLEHEEVTPLLSTAITVPINVVAAREIHISLPPGRKAIHVHLADVSCAEVLTHGQFWHVYPLPGPLSASLI